MKGGVRTGLKKAAGVYQREGAKGILKRVRDVLFDKNENTNYQLWIERYDRLTPESRLRLRNRVRNFRFRPLVSILMPTYNPKPEWLVEAIESVRNQIYPHWQLCIADDASTDPAIRPLLERYAAADPRIRVTFRAQNGHISRASNSALELAQGEWIALLDHDDVLSEQALAWVVEALRQKPRLQLIYSDEDKIDERGIRQNPYFKCDWNEDLFYSHNLITHLGVYRAKLVRKIGGFRPGLEGAQDYDLALRCVELIQPGQIHHIPRILYHWRLHSASTAQSSASKPYAMLAGQRALQEHFRRTKKNVKVEYTGFAYRIRYALPRRPPLASLIIPTRNGLKLLKTCVESILQKTTYPRYEILVVDNGSDDPDTLRYLETLKKNKKIRVLRDEGPFNYAALNNRAIRKARGQLIGLLNNDLEVISPDWLSEMASHALRPEIGAVGAKLYYPNNRIQHAGVVIGIGGIAGHAFKHFLRNYKGQFGRPVLIQNYSAVTAACLVVRKSVFDEVGGLDEVHLKVALNDVDFCLKAREKGYRNLFTPYAELYHYESASRGYEDTPDKKLRFEKEKKIMYRRWGKGLFNDPAYSPNLTLDHENFGLAWPPRIAGI